MKQQEDEFVQLDIQKLVASTHFNEQPEIQIEAIQEIKNKIHIDNIQSILDSRIHLQLNTLNYDENAQKVVEEKLKLYQKIMHISNYTFQLQKINTYVNDLLNIDQLSLHQMWHYIQILNIYIAKTFDLQKFHFQILLKNYQIVEMLSEQYYFGFSTENINTQKQLTRVNNTRQINLEYDTTLKIEKQLFKISKLEVLNGPKSIVIELFKQIVLLIQNKNFAQFLKLFNLLQSVLKNTATYPTQFFTQVKQLLITILYNRKQTMEVENTFLKQQFYIDPIDDALLTNIKSQLCNLADVQQLRDVFVSEFKQSNRQLLKQYLVNKTNSNIIVLNEQLNDDLINNLTAQLKSNIKDAGLLFPCYLESQLLLQNSFADYYLCFANIVSKFNKNMYFTEQNIQIMIEVQYVLKRHSHIIHFEQFNEIENQLKTYYTFNDKQECHFLEKINHFNKQQYLLDSTQLFINFINSSLLNIQTTNISKYENNKLLNIFQNQIIYSRLNQQFNQEENRDDMSKQKYYNINKINLALELLIITTENIQIFILKRVITNNQFLLHLQCQLVCPQFFKQIHETAVNQNNQQRNAYQIDQLKLLENKCNLYNKLHNETFNYQFYSTFICQLNLIQTVNNQYSLFTNYIVNGLCMNNQFIINNNVNSLPQSLQINKEFLQQVMEQQSNYTQMQEHYQHSLQALSLIHQNQTFKQILNLIFQLTTNQRLQINNDSQTQLIDNKHLLTDSTVSQDQQISKKQQKIFNQYSPEIDKLEQQQIFDLISNVNILHNKQTIQLIYNQNYPQITLLIFSVVQLIIINNSNTDHQFKIQLTELHTSELKQLLCNCIIDFQYYFGFYDKNQFQLITEQIKQLNIQINKNKFKSQLDTTLFIQIASEILQLQQFTIFNDQNENISLNNVLQLFKQTVTMEILLKQNDQQKFVFQQFKYQNLIANENDVQDYLHFLSFLQEKDVNVAYQQYTKNINQKITQIFQLQNQQPIQQQKFNQQFKLLHKQMNQYVENNNIVQQQNQLLAQIVIVLNQQVILKTGRFIEFKPLYVIPLKQLLLFVYQGKIMNNTDILIFKLLVIYRALFDTTKQFYTSLILFPEDINRSQNQVLQQLQSIHQNVLTYDGAETWNLPTVQLQLNGDEEQLQLQYCWRQNGVQISQFNNQYDLSMNNQLQEQFIQNYFNQLDNLSTLQNLNLPENEQFVPFHGNQLTDFFLYYLQNCFQFAQQKFQYFQQSSQKIIKLQENTIYRTYTNSEISSLLTYYFAVKNEKCADLNNTCTNINFLEAKQLSLQLFNIKSQLNNQLIQQYSFNILFPYNLISLYITIYNMERVNFSSETFQLLLVCYLFYPELTEQLLSVKDGHDFQGAIYRFCTLKQISLLSVFLNFFAVIEDLQQQLSSKLINQQQFNKQVLILLILIQYCNYKQTLQLDKWALQKFIECDSCQKLHKFAIDFAKMSIQIRNKSDAEKIKQFKQRRVAAYQIACLLENEEGSQEIKEMLRFIVGKQ